MNTSRFNGPAFGTSAWLANRRFMLEQRSRMNLQLFPRKFKFDGPPNDPDLRPLFPVDLVRNGGEAGSGSEYCSYNYDVFDLAGLQLNKPLGGDPADAIPPLCSRARDIKQACLPATHGSAYKDFNGEVVLWNCDERQGYPSSDFPWAVFQWTPQGPPDSVPATYWRNVRVHKGTVNGDTTDLVTYVHELDPGLAGGGPGSPAGSDYDIHVPQSQTEYKIWAEVTYTRSAPCITGDGGTLVTHVAIKHGASWWSGHPGQFPTAGKYFFEIATIESGVDDPPELSPGVPNPDFQFLAITQIENSDKILDPPAQFMCLATKDGGASGGQGVDCDLTYEVADYCGNIVLSTATPDLERMPGVGYDDAGGKGMVYYDGSGNLRLASVSGEIPLLDDLELVEDVQWDDPELQKKMRPIKGWKGDAATPGWDTWETAVDCP